MHSKLQGLQALRFIAAALVLGTHSVIWGGRPLTSPGQLGPYDGLGACGVDIFFVLSGAIIYKTALEFRQQTASEFLLRRFTRVAPIYYLITFALLPLGSPHDWPSSHLSVASTLLFWPAWDHMAVPILGVGWTLCFEMLFYVSAACVLAFRRSLWVLVAVFFSCWLARVQTGWLVFQFSGTRSS